MYIEKDYSLNHWSFGNNLALLISGSWCANDSFMSMYFVVFLIVSLVTTDSLLFGNCYGNRSSAV